MLGWNSINNGYKIEWQKNDETIGFATSNNNGDDNKRRATIDLSSSKNFGNLKARMEVDTQIYRKHLSGEKIKMKFSIILKQRVVKTFINTLTH